MIRLAHIIQTFEADFLQQHHKILLPSQRTALAAFKACRSTMSPSMLLACEACPEQIWLPHSCGHRSCPHCQAHESQCWIDRQVQKLVAGQYSLITFTVPKEFRALVWANQKQLYSLMTQSAWDTVNTFAHNDKKLKGQAGAITVLHTHNRRLDFHPHVHLVMPAAAIDTKKRLWRTKNGAYLFNDTALAKVFRAKMLAGIKQLNLSLPAQYPQSWVVNCKSVGNGHKALVYLGRYLYRGVIQEKDILSCKDGMVTFRYQDSKTKQFKTRTVSGVEFLRLILQHILPKGYRRVRCFGFLHPNSRWFNLLRLLIRPGTGSSPSSASTSEPRLRPAVQCKCCGALMRIVRTRVKPGMQTQGMNWPQASVQQECLV